MIRECHKEGGGRKEEGGRRTEFIARIARYTPRGLLGKHARLSTPPPLAAIAFTGRMIRVMVSPVIKPVTTAVPVPRREQGIGGGAARQPSTGGGVDAPPGGKGRAGRGSVGGCRRSGALPVHRLRGRRPTETLHHLASGPRRAHALRSQLWCQRPSEPPATARQARRPARGSCIAVGAEAVALFAACPSPASFISAFLHARAHTRNTHTRARVLSPASSMPKIY